MKYTFLLPAYKATFFKDALGSILSQTYTDFNVIVSDDCSSEDLKSIVDKFKDPRVTYRRNDKNIGAEHLVDHWNLLLRLTDAEYVVMASDDDVYDTRYLEEMDKLVCMYTDIDVFRPKLRLIDSNGKVSWSEKNEFECNPVPRNYFLELVATEKMSSGISQYIFKKRALDRIGGFINYPYASFSDDATVMTLSDNGLIINNNFLFSFRHSGLSISTRKPCLLECEGKLKASVDYMKYFESVIKDISLANKMTIRVQKIAIEMLKTSTDSNFFLMMRYIGNLHTSQFPLGWRIKRYMGRLYHKIV